MQDLFSENGTPGSGFNFSELTTESIALYKDGKILACNSNFIRCFGYENAEEIKGTNLFHFFPRIYREILNTDEANSGKRLETLCVRKDSATFPAVVFVKVVPSGDEVLNVLIVQDETERQNLEARLLKSTVFQRAVLNSASFAIITTDFNGKIKTFNKGAEKMFGYLAKTLIDKKDITVLFSPEDNEKHSRAISKEIKKKDVSTFEGFAGRLQIQEVDEQKRIGVRNDNTHIICSVTATTLKDNLNEINGYLFICSDITDKKKAEEEITTKSQLLNGIAANMPVFIFRVNAEGKFTECFGSALEKVGSSAQEVIGLDIYETLPENADAIRLAYEGEFVSFIDSRKIDQEEVHHEFYVFPDLSNNGGITGFALNISDRKNYEKNLKKSARNLEKINQELDQFAYIVSHDLKAPLRAITNLSQWIEEDAADVLDDDSKQNLSLLRDRVQRMQDFIDGILNYSRIGRLKVETETVEVKNLLEQVIDALAIPEGFNIRVQENIPPVLFNKTWLEQVFTNLIGNAVKYHHKKEGHISINYQENEREHVFSVADDGPGIHPDYHEKIFLIFQTLDSKDRTDSTGIGLTIVKKIIEEHGGEIWVESDGESGTTFTFTIPKGI